MRRALTVFGLFLLVAGIPAVLVEVIGAPFVPQVSLASARETLAGPFLTIDTVLHALGLVTWALWGYLVVVVLLRAAALVFLRRQHRAGATFAALTARLAPSALMRLIDASLGGVLLLSPVSVGISSPSATISAFQMRIADSMLPEPTPMRSYVVRPGDSIWVIAERELGSNLRWEEIFRLNEGRSFADGRVLKDPNLIRPNWVLWLPADVAGNPASPSQPPPARPVLSHPAAEQPSRDCFHLSPGTH